jgi:hypothetical protein
MFWVKGSQSSTLMNFVQLREYFMQGASDIAGDIHLHSRVISYQEASRELPSSSAQIQAASLENVLLADDAPVSATSENSEDWFMASDDRPEPVLSQAEIPESQLVVEEDTAPLLFDCESIVDLDRIKWKDGIEVTLEKQRPLESQAPKSDGKKWTPGDFAHKSTR